MNILSFDTKKADESGRIIRAELSSLKNLTRKLINEVDRIPGWWVGDSNRTVCK